MEISRRDALRRLSLESDDSLSTWLYTIPHQAFPQIITQLYRNLTLPISIIVIFRISHRFTQPLILNKFGGRIISLRFLQTLLFSLIALFILTMIFGPRLTCLIDSTILDAIISYFHFTFIDSTPLLIVLHVGLNGRYVWLEFQLRFGLGQDLFLVLQVVVAGGSVELQQFFFQYGESILVFKSLLFEQIQFVLSLLILAGFLTGVLHQSFVFTLQFLILLFQLVQSLLTLMVFWLYVQFSTIFFINILLLEQFIDGLMFFPEWLWRKRGVWLVESTLVESFFVGILQMIAK